MVKLSTFSATEEALQQTEQNQTSQTSVNETGNLEAANLSQEAASVTPATQETQTQEAAATQENQTTQAAQSEQAEDFTTTTFTIPGEQEQGASQEQQQSQQQAAYDWKAEVKKLNKSEVLKELGVSDFIIGMETHLANGGKSEDYLYAKSIDYNTVSDESLLKDKYKKQFPNLSEPEINRLFSRKYGVTDDMLEEEKEDRALQLKTDGYIERQQKIEEQKKFQIADKPIIHTDEGYENYKKQQSELEDNINQIREFYNSHPATKTLNESKRVTINFGEGVQPFNFSIDKPELLTQSLTDGGKMWRQATFTQSGEPDVAKQQLISLFSLNPQQFIMNIFNYGRKIEERKKVEAGQNAQKPVTVIPGGNQTGKPTYAVGKFGSPQ